MNWLLKPHKRLGSDDNACMDMFSQLRVCGWQKMILVLQKTVIFGSVSVLQN